LTGESLIFADRGSHCLLNVLIFALYSIKTLSSFVLCLSSYVWFVWVRNACEYLSLLYSKILLILIL